MDLSSILKTLTSNDSVNQLSSLTGTSQTDVSNILSSALPQLLNGAQQQATNKDTAAGFANALAAHSKDNSDDIMSFFGGVDMADGQKIVNHLLGQKQAAQTAQNISQKSGVSTANISNVLSAAAPLLMTLMGKQATSQAKTAQTAQANAQGGLDLGNIVGSLFGGGADKDNDGLDIGDILGGLFK
ncbi:MAG: DUF937 domain-containing protein [Lachnospiraceae bacterium]|nr:DUF937 domain-containing protein [Lachnospiraceae bacterium]